LDREDTEDIGMATIRARIDLTRVAKHGVDPTRLTPPRVEEVESDLRNRGLVRTSEHGWWSGDDAIIRTLGDAVLETDPPGVACPPTGR
jgi:hypothetical protein